MWNFSILEQNLIESERQFSRTASFLAWTMHDNVLPMLVNRCAASATKCKHFQGAYIFSESIN